MSLKTIGYYILIFSLIFLVGSGIYRLFEKILFDSKLNLVHKISITGLIVGIIVLLAGLISERIKEDDR